MITMKETEITKTASNKLLVEREFDAPIEKVWNAWTDSKILDLWWAPKPWKARTKTMNFTEGGNWLYAMVGPEGEEHWATMDFKTIDAPNRFTGEDAFSDENGNKVTDPPGMKWDVKFNSSNGGTKVQVDITFASEADLQKIVEMGFKEGFTAAHGNLDELLAKQ